MIWVQSDATKKLHRWCCSCGHNGVWLNRLEFAQRNGDLHVMGVHQVALAVRPVQAR